jgi:hypothetical protein
MKFVSGILGGAAFLAGLSTAALAATAAEPKEAQVTQIIREVKVLPSQADPRDALINDKISEDTGVKTGEESRSELTFPDLTITRLGANTIFSFSKAGRTANVDSGSILLRVPKNSGGGSIRSTAVTVAITGTTVIFETAADGVSRLITLEGNSRLSFTNKPEQFRRVRAGQMLEVPPGATELPMPVYIDLRQLMRTHPLIVDFRPLPSQPLIMAVAEKRPPPATPKAPPPQPPPPTRPPGQVPTPPVVDPGQGGPGERPSPTPKTYPSPTADPERTATPTPPKPSPTAGSYPNRTATPSPTPTATPVVKPSPTPRVTPTPRPSPTAKPSPKPSATKPPVKPTPTPTPVILRKAPTQTATAPPVATKTAPSPTVAPRNQPTPRVQRVIKRPTPPPIR